MDIPMNLLFPSVAILAVSALGFGYWQAQKPDAREMIVRACEGQLKNCLRSPSTYQRVGVTNFRDGSVMTADDLAAYPDFSDRNPEFLEVLASDGSYLHYQYAISYDAANAYGAPIRGMVRCDYAGLSHVPIQEGALLDVSVRVDGQNSSDRTKELLRRIRSQG